MNSSELPDLAAVALLAGAFASISKHSYTHISGVWLTGWMMIVLHFAAFLFTTLPGIWGILAGVIGLIALAWGGTLFMWASVPVRQGNSSWWMLAAILGAIAIYIPLLLAFTVPDWALNLAASLFGLLPLAVALVAMRNFDSSQRWLNVAQYCPLSIFLLIIQRQHGNGTALALNALLFTVYFGCCIHFWYSYRRATAGAIITIAGFLTWGLVFVAVPLMTALWPAVHIASQMWNLPKLGYYVVAVGMILLLLEGQIAYNKNLALQDDLTSTNTRQFILNALTSLTSIHDVDTGAHVLRVQHHSKLLCNALASDPQYHQFLTPKTIQVIYELIPIHDIGKISVPDHILRKNGSLTPEEFEIIKTHVTIPKKALFEAIRSSGIKDETSLRIARDIILTHHERWNGSGYPGGLSGENIPMAGRIVAVLDVYDAMVSKRAYKEPMSHHSALEFITKNRGIHFDPRVVDAFVQVEEEIRQINTEVEDPLLVGVQQPRKPEWIIG